MSDRKYVIYGAGAIGGTIGARLALCNHDVTLIARGEHARAMQQHGLRLRAPGEDVTVSIPVQTHPSELAPNVREAAEVVVMLCMKTQHTEQALQDLLTAGIQNPHVMCVQNGVANERLAQAHFEQVYATVVNLPALHLVPGEVTTHATGYGGILDTGCYPGGINATCEAVTADLRAAGFSAFADARVMRWKYAKLLMNLGNILQAGFSSTTDMGEVGRHLRREALACYTAAGIECASKDEVQERHRDTYRMADVAGVERTGGSSWQSVARGTGDLETVHLNGEICALGAACGVPTPYNAACLEMAEAVLAAGAAGTLSIDDFNTWLTT